MISVENAFKLIDQNRPDFGVETVTLHDSLGRVLAQDAKASFSQPTHPTSGMDGYAFRREDMGAEFTVIGESRAGAPFDGAVGQGEAVRIFTGAVLPDGSDIVEIQEHAVRDGQTLSFTQFSKGRNYVRPAGLDFKEGDLVLKAGTHITAGVLMGLAALNIEEVQVRKRPIVAVLRGGDEVKPVGSALRAGELIDSNGPGIMALLSSWGVSVMDLGLISDDPDVIKACISKSDADIIVPIGGASVGDYDYMKSSASELGFEPVFSKVAVKPGKPVWFSRKGSQLILGLPGNPRSAWASSHLFLAHLLGRSLKWETYHLKGALPENGGRETYIRGVTDAKGSVTPMLTAAGATRSIADSNVLIRRAPMADGLAEGEEVECLCVI